MAVRHGLQVLDAKGAWRCVRFESGDVGVVDAQGEPVLVGGPYQGLKFIGHDFLKVTHGREFYVDMKNGEMYACQPELIRFGDFELASIGGFLCTRTKRLYEVPAIPAEAELGKLGLYLRLPCEGEPGEEHASRMLGEQKQCGVCLLNGDESGVYWLLGVFRDGTPLVMDDEGNYYRATRDVRSRRAVKELLGQVRNAADKAVMLHRVREVEEQVAARQRRESAKARQEAERERAQQMQALVSAEPFHIGNKWGLRSKGRIVVPPIYRTVQSPVGHYCAVESCPGIWGVIALDGRVEVEPRYEQVEIHTDGTVDLTVRQGKRISLKLKI